jgi:uncharacterized protein
MSQNDGRRSFIKKGLTTAAGIGLFSQSGTLTKAQKLAARITGNAMPKRKLGKTGYDVSLFGLGGQATLEQPGKLYEAVEIINSAVDLGVNYIDTAAFYGGGISEMYIGEVMQYRRDEVFLATKSHNRGYSGTMQLIEQSLQRLKTDYVNLYYLHDVRTQAHLNSIFSPNGAINAFEELKSDGIVNFIGISGHYDPTILKKAIEQYDFDCILMALNAADVHHLPFQYDLLDAAIKRNLGIIAMKIPARGRMFQGGDNGITSMEQALRYVYSFPISTAIVGIDTIEQLEENVDITQSFQKYSEQELYNIEQLTAHYYQHASWYKDYS